jgi:uncharacterized protein (TIGR02646 family)
MRLIVKSKEPNKLTQYRISKQGSYDDYQEKNMLREFLLKEQQYLCAYCMCRIENNPLLTKIDHWKPKSKEIYKNLELDYSNLFAVCSGKNGGILHCDTSKDRNEIRISPIEVNSITNINYKVSKDLINLSSNYPIHNDDINSPKKLNLNFYYIAKNRHQALNTFKLQIPKKYAGKKADLIKEISLLNNLEKLPPYFGVLEEYCKKRDV